MCPGAMPQFSIQRGAQLKFAIRSQPQFSTQGEARHKVAIRSWAAILNPGRSVAKKYVLAMPQFSTQGGAAQNRLHSFGRNSRPRDEHG